MKSLKKILPGAIYISLGFMGVFLGGFILSLLGVRISEANEPTTEYKWQIEQCLKARDTKNGGAGGRSITDFICPDGPVQWAQDIAYQVVLDLEFRKLDKKLETELKWLQGQKTKKVVDSSEKIKKLFDTTGPGGKDSFTSQYGKVCEDLSKEGHPLRDTIAAFSGSSYSVTTDGNTANFIVGQQACTQLVGKKMDAYRDTAELIQTQNIVDSFKDDKEVFTTELKDNYQKFLLQWTIYIGELSKIKNKWPSKTKTQNQW